MLDTSVIYPFLVAVVSVSVLGIAVAVGLLVRESRTRRRGRPAVALGWGRASGGKSIGWNVGGVDRRPPS